MSGDGGSGSGGGGGRRLLAPAPCAAQLKTCQASLKAAPLACTKKLSDAATACSKQVAAQTSLATKASGWAAANATAWKTCSAGSAKCTADLAAARGWASANSTALAACKAGWGGGASSNLASVRLATITATVQANLAYFRLQVDNVNSVRGCERIGQLTPFNAHRVHTRARHPPCTQTAVDAAKILKQFALALNSSDSTCADLIDRMLNWQDNLSRVGIDAIELVEALTGWVNIMQGAQPDGDWGTGVKQLWDLNADAAVANVSVSDAGLV